MRHVATILVGFVLLVSARTVVPVEAFGARWPSTKQCQPGDSCCPQPTERSSVPEIQPAVVRVVSTTATDLWIGTGVLVQPSVQLDFGVILTADHVLPTRPDDVVVVFHDCRVTAHVIGRDKILDLALLSIPLPTANPYKISPTVPRIGDTLWAAGFIGETGRFEITPGKLLRFASSNDKSEEFSLMLSGSVDDGVSGGVIANSAGLLVGIVSTSDHEFVIGTHSVYILSFMARALATRTMSPMIPPPELTVPRGSQNGRGERGPRDEPDTSDQVEVVSIDDLTELVLKRLLGTDDDPGLLPPLYIRFGTEAAPVGEKLEKYLGDTLYLHGYLVELPE